MLAICGSRMYVFFIDAAVTERLLTAGPLSLSPHVPARGGGPAGGGWWQAAQVHPDGHQLARVHGGTSLDGDHRRHGAVEAARRRQAVRRQARARRAADGVAAR
eukprot:5916248-Prymnesium_polylepis.1